VARARQVELHCDEPFARAAARIVEIRAGEVFEFSGGVLDAGEPERVHDMRVATRRLRAAMEVFASCFPRKRLRKTLKDVKALADALGARRDCDVEIEFLEWFAAEVEPGERETITAMVAGLREEQARANDALAPFVAEKRLSKLRRRLAKLVEKAKI
jgi:CHAD domain-containing protein